MILFHHGTCFLGNGFVLGDYKAVEDAVVGTFACTTDRHFATLTISCGVANRTDFDISRSINPDCIVVCPALDSVALYLTTKRRPLQARSSGSVPLYRVSGIPSASKPRVPGYFVSESSEGLSSSAQFSRCGRHCKPRATKCGAEDPPARIVRAASLRVAPFRYAALYHAQGNAVKARAIQGQWKEPGIAVQGKCNQRRWGLGVNYLLRC